MQLSLLITEIFITLKRNPVPIKQFLIFPFPWPLVITNLLPVLMDLPTLDISCKWNHIICVFFYLASFSQHNIFKVHPWCRMYQYFFTSSGWIIFHCIDMSHFVHSSVDAHLDCFHFWAIMRLLWMFMYKFLCGHMFSIILGMYLRVELLDHMVTLVPSLKRLPDCFVKQLHQFTFPPAVYKLMVSDLALVPVLLLRGCSPRWNHMQTSWGHSSDHGLGYFLWYIGFSRSCYACLLTDCIMNKVFIKHLLCTELCIRLREVQNEHRSGFLYTKVCIFVRRANGKSSFRFNLIYCFFGTAFLGHFLGPYSFRRKKSFPHN